MENLKLILIAFAVFLMFAVQASAQEAFDQPNAMAQSQAPHPPNLTKTGDVGIGVLLGTPSALNVKFWTAEDLAFNTNVTFSQGDLALMGDYLWHFRRAFSPDVTVDKPAVVVPYIGIGVLAIFDTSGTQKSDRPLYRRTQNEEGVGIGARLPIGLEFMPEAWSTGFYGELAPGAIITPSYFSFFQAGVGARYYF